jgi:hypothetical protein
MFLGVHREVNQGATSEGRAQIASSEPPRDEHRDHLLPGASPLRWRPISRLKLDKKDAHKLPVPVVKINCQKIMAT